MFIVSISISYMPLVQNSLTHPPTPQNTHPPPPQRTHPYTHQCPPYNPHKHTHRPTPTYHHHHHPAFTHTHPRYFENRRLKKKTRSVQFTVHAFE